MLFPSETQLFAQIISYIVGGFILSMVVSGILLFISYLLTYARSWVLDDFSIRHNVLLEYTRKKINFGIFKNMDSFGKLLFSMYLTLLYVLFYKVGIACTIIFAMLYLSRSVVRLKTALSTHIKDKKAHK